MTYTDSGTGTYLGNRVVITAAHVVGNRSGNTVTVAFSKSSIRGRVVRVDTTYDLAAITLESTPNVTPAGLADHNAALGETVTKCGLTTGCRSGRVLGYSAPSSGPADWFIVSAGSRDGDSGGPIFSRGRLIGVLWGSRDGQTRATNLTRCKLFLRGLLAKSRQKLSKPPKVVHGKTGPAGPKGETGPPGPIGNPGKSSEVDRELRLAVQANASAIAAITRQMEIVAKNQKDQSAKIRETQVTNQDILVLVQRNTIAIEKLVSVAGTAPDENKLNERIDQLEKKIPAYYEIIAGKPKPGE